MNFQVKPLLLFLLLMLTNLSACLRFIPARIDEDSSALSSDSTDFVVGSEAFYQFERSQEERLRKLIQERASDRVAAGEEDYRVGPGDLIEVSVYDVAELNRKVRVRPSGLISLPLVGSMSVQGLTESELQDLLTKKVEKYVYSPQVQVFIQEYAAHMISVIGEVSKPGTYPLRRQNYSLIELLSEAGGRTEKASGAVILIPAKREKTRASHSRSLTRGKLADPSGRFGIEIYFDDLIGSADQPPLEVPLTAGDTIVVPESGLIQVYGEAQRPGSFQLASRMSLLGAIAAAGGVTYSADIGKVEVIRELGSGKKAILQVNLEEVALRKGDDVRLRDGDVIRIPSERGRFVTRQVVDAINGLFSVGVSQAVP